MEWRRSEFAGMVFVSISERCLRTNSACADHLRRPPNRFVGIVPVASATGTRMTYLNAALDIVIVALFGWLLVELIDWAAKTLHEREVKRQRKAETDAMFEFWQ